MYEVSWNRQIGLLFGYTAQSAGIVMTVYFLGMAFGYYLAGKTIDKTTTPLYHYGFAEIIAGIWALLIPFFLQQSHESLSPWINAPQQKILWRTLFASVVLFPSTIALGYSFPAFAKFLALSKRSKSIIPMYATNTLGALLGTFLAGILFLYRVGVTGTNYCAAIISICCGIVAIVIAKSHRQQQSQKKSNERLIPYYIYFFALLSGFSILGLEVLYTHLFAFISQNSTYNFSATLCSFLFALSIGSFFATRVKNDFTSFAWICITVASAIPLSLWCFSVITSGKILRSTSNFYVYLLKYFTLSAAIIVIPISVAGIILPLCWRFFSENHGRIIGHITFINILFSALGAATATFIFIPHLGLHASFLFFAFIYLCAGVFAIVQTTKTKYTLWQIASCVAILLLCFFTPSATKYEYRDYDIIWHDESFYGPITVVRHQSSDNLKMIQNHHYTLGSSRAENREKRQAHIPLLLHPKPESIAFLGMGTGMTVKGALSYKEIKKIDVIELIPEVVAAARLFHKETNNLFEDKRTHIVINDARHHLYQQQDNYDVLISDLFVPWHSHTGYLYTKEHYITAKKSLKKNGLFCQWLPLYQLGKREFLAIANTFSSVFDNTILWRGENNKSYPLIALIGGKNDWKINENNVRKRLSTTTQKTQIRILKGRMQVILSPDRFLNATEFFTLYVGKWLYDKNKEINSDEYPLVEFSTPITLAEGRLLRGKQLEHFYSEVLNVLVK
ncbi:fused MFS/spermidine synthase [Candidatus Uabimicrobium sp. HlEnr_7]|uniref:fused MFS/spermidine synthase n=1 Tax=Candidatus Uabimicrobium helgolandensis TaxID=3095367 RepID=UPI003556F566